MGTRSKYVNGALEFLESSTFETMRPMQAVIFEDDFTSPGSAVVPAAGSAESGCRWVKKIVGAAPPTVAQVANSAGGIMACALTSASQKQNADLYWGDVRNLSLDRNLNFEAWVKHSVLATSGSELVWGLAGDWVDGPDNIAQNIWFKCDGSGAVKYEGDDGTTDTDDQSTGVTIVNTDWKLYRIQCAGASGAVVATFYIGGAKVGTYTFAATGAALVLQPYFSCYKASGTSVGTMQIDNVRIWQSRS